MTRSTDARDRQVDPVPERVFDAHPVPRRGVGGVGQLALDAEERLEHHPHRLAEAFGGVLHPGVKQREPAIPGRRAADAAVVEAPHREPGEER